MNAAELAAANTTGRTVVRIAINLGAVVIAYHWPSFAVPALRLNGSVAYQGMTPGYSGGTCAGGAA